MPDVIEVRDPRLAADVASMVAALGLIELTVNDLQYASTALIVMERGVLFGPVTTDYSHNGGDDQTYYMVAGENVLTVVDSRYRNQESVENLSGIKHVFIRYEWDD